MRDNVCVCVGESVRERKSSEGVYMDIYKCISVSERISRKAAVSSLVYWSRGEYRPALSMLTREFKTGQ